MNFRCKFFVVLAVAATASAGVSAQDTIDARAAAQLARETGVAAARQQAASEAVSPRRVKAPPMPERRSEVELITVKGFAGRLEAVVAVDGRRATASMRTPHLYDGWTLTKLAADCAEVVRSGAKPESRTICFVAPGPGAPMVASAPAGGSGGAKPPLPAGMPMPATR